MGQQRAGEAGARSDDRRFSAPVVLSSKASRRLVASMRELGSATALPASVWERVERRPDELEAQGL